jgi:hypothetical protein
MIVGVPVSVIGDDGSVRNIAAYVDQDDSAVFIAAQINLSDQSDTDLRVAAAGECELISAGSHAQMKLNQIFRLVI